ncbi:MAG: hypothetical protein WAJ93_18305 [Candidatus Nitrosopolaris sp.]
MLPFRMSLGIHVTNPIRRSETILELKGRNNLEWWDKDLCEYGWLTGRKERSAETNEIFDQLFDREENSIAS